MSANKSSTGTKKAVSANKEEPLSGWRILTTRASKQSGGLAAPLREMGAEVIEIPTIEIKPPSSYKSLDAALGNVAKYDWLILTSVNGVEALFARLKKLRIAPDKLTHLQVAAIGPATQREIEKHGRKCVDSNQLFIDGLKIPISDRIGEEGKGFEYILHGFNPERMLIAAEAVGLGRAAINLAARYANERIVFDRQIGKNQAIQHPLAQRWMELFGQADAKAIEGEHRQPLVWIPPDPDGLGVETA